MSVLNDIIADVYALTNRPDWVNETFMAVRAATLKAHQREFYAKDLIETGINFPTSDYQQAIEPKSLFPRYRSMKYLRKFDAVNSTPGVFLKERTPESILDSYKSTYANIWYQAGIEIQINMDTKEQFMLLGIYAHPDITAAGYNSWIAQEFPFAVTFEATATIFKLLGMADQVARYSGLAAEQYTLIDTSNITSSGE